MPSKTPSMMTGHCSRRFKTAEEWSKKAYITQWISGQEMMRQNKNEIQRHQYVRYKRFSLQPHRLERTGERPRDMERMDFSIIWKGKVTELIRNIWVMTASWLMNTSMNDELPLVFTVAAALLARASHIRTVLSPLAVANWSGLQGFQHNWSTLAPCPRKTM